jgi:hypothetical protein
MWLPQWHLAYLVPLPHELLAVMLESPHAYIMGIHSDWLPEIHKLLDEKRSLGEEVRHTYTYHNRHRQTHRDRDDHAHTYHQKRYTQIKGQG